MDTQVTQPLPRHDRFVGVALTLISGLAFATLPIFNRVATANDANTVTVLGLRFGIAAIVVWLLLLRRGQFAIPWRRALGLCAMGALYVLQSTAFFTSSVRIPVAVTSILLYLYPAIVTLLARLLLREPLTRRKLISLALALGGCVLTLGAPQVGNDWVGIGFGILSAVLYSLYIIMGARLQAGIPALTSSAYIMTSAGVIFLVFGLFTGQLNLALNGAAYGSIVGLALLCTVVAVMLFLSGIKRIGAAQASIISTVEVVGTAALGVLILGEELGLLQLIGGAFVIGAVVLLSSQRPHSATELDMHLTPAQTEQEPASA